MTSCATALERGHKLANEISGELERSHSITSKLLTTAIATHYALNICYYIIKLRLDAYRMMRHFRELADTIDTCLIQARPNECEECFLLEESLPSIGEKLLEICEMQRVNINRMRESNWPKLIITIQEGILYDMEDIAENSLIGADKELRQLVDDLSNSNA